MDILSKLRIKESELKQAIVVRTDLEMGKGKTAAQCAHASISAYLKTERTDPESAEKWIEEGMKKVVLKVTGEKELFQYFQQAKDAGLPVEIIRDAGLTQIKSGSATCFAIGPADEKEIDNIVGKLKLL
ncbi:peptidyl-tRNA hydrolase Pth2 [Candidatus Micrarchaeota archaeon]|nr:peptidyl-tRNA hydrolase Pth2 [Candidatus Micrarchaeota archaeon]